MDRKKGRGRPEKTDEKEKSDKELTKNLFGEIRASSGLTIEKFFDEIFKSNFPKIKSEHSVSAWGKYSCGSLAMGDDRAKNLAAWAWSKGWRGPNVKAVLLANRWAAHQDTNKISDKIEKSIKKLEVLFEQVLVNCIALRIEDENSRVETPEETEFYSKQNKEMEAELGINCHMSFIPNLDPNPTTDDIDHFNLLIKSASESAINKLRIKIEHDEELENSKEYQEYERKLLDEKMKNSITIKTSPDSGISQLIELPQFLRKEK
jgi:hypothetical protein